VEFCTLAEIAQHNARMREQLVSLVVSASPELRAWRPAPEKWSIQEHLEHLVRNRPASRQLWSSFPPWIPTR
jgi:uncharacterized damage-inducible protein DinB